ncbi:MAG: cytotoxic translational repressor of toxin-antitoxin stability system [Gammaproteobacteria bacterium]|nr:cytotoxic translational repressor of toxin-antitoxin stability system [Gammaproteobacteria bacterium]
MSYFDIKYSTNWNVELTRSAKKQIDKLNQRALFALRLLIEDLRRNGPAPGKGWPNYGKLTQEKQRDCRHCHLKKGKPTYVCCWEIKDKQKQIIEIYYVGTHEKAPY